MDISGQQLEAATIERISGVVRSAPADSRSGLSRRICEQMDWRGANGRLQEMSCRKVLACLQSQGIIELPEIEETYSFQRSTDRAEADIYELFHEATKNEGDGNPRHENRLARPWKIGRHHHRF